jgi:hypothetical protein
MFIRLKTKEKAITKKNSNDINKYTFVETISFNYKIF